MSQVDGIFEQAVTDHFSFGNALYIDAQSLRECPVAENKKIYQQLGKFVTTVTLSGVTEENARLIFAHFKYIRELTLHKVVFLGEEIKGYPTRIERFQIIDCRIHETQIKKWFKRISHTLISIQVSRSNCKFPIGGSGSISSLIRMLPNVAHIRIREAGYLRFTTTSKSLTRLELVGSNCYILENVPALRYLSYDAPFSTYSCIDPAQTFLHKLNCRETLRWLMLRQCPDDYEVLLLFKNLSYLRIVESVEPEVIMTLQGLENLKELDVHSFLPPDEDNLILTSLNDDCLLKVLSYLSQQDWISVGKAHSRFNHLVCDYMIPRANIAVDDDFLCQYPLDERRDVYRMIGRHAKSLKFSCTQIQAWERVIPNFKRLTKLQIFGRKSMAKDHLNLIPDGLQVLRIVSSKQHSLKRLFKRLNPTLKTLDINGQFDTSDLLELHQLREFKWDGFERDVNSSLGQNKNLERLEMSLTRGAAVPEDFVISPLKNLKVLHLHFLYFNIELKPKDFPSLEEIYVSFAPISRVIETVSSFYNLKSLFISTFETWEIRKLHPLKNLKRLEIDGKPVDEEGLLYIIRQIPPLVHLKTPNSCYSLKFEIDLQRLLTEERRMINLHSQNGQRVVIFASQ